MRWEPPLVLHGAHHISDAGSTRPPQVTVSALNLLEPRRVRHERALDERKRDRIPGGGGRVRAARQSLEACSVSAIWRRCISDRSYCG